LDFLSRRILVHFDGLLLKLIHLFQGLKGTLDLFFQGFLL
jgi:hypothetical protein